jgi:hypothetical protein
MAEAASPSSHSSFREEVFSRCSCCGGACVKRRAADTAAPTTRMRWTGQIFWLLAYDACATPHLLPAFTLESGIGILPMSRWARSPCHYSKIGPVGSRIQLQQRNCSRFSRDFLRRSTFPSSQRTGTRTTGLRFDRQDYLIISQLLQSFRAKSRNPVAQLKGNFAGYLDFARHDC